MGKKKQGRKLTVNTTKRIQYGGGEGHNREIRGKHQLSQKLREDVKTNWRKKKGMVILQKTTVTKKTIT